MFLSPDRFLYVQGFVLGVGRFFHRGIRGLQIKLALTAFLFKQWITCILGHAAVQFGLLAYPFRELAESNRTSFTYEYMAHPVACAVFIVYYPSHRSRWIQIGYYVLFCTVLTVVEIVIQRYTDLIRYIRWNWFWSWGSLFLTFMVTRVFCVLYFRTMNQQKNAATVPRS
ncbi:CBO0543 family protein [Cohnella pontilimi]|uniref:CBO0543 family protein n=1 Tax=Cohnella pontilimi TaxID=2564100 RepID=UPI0024823342|nr:CBO0543 family protein [Cohnella pontilimi]